MASLLHADRHLSHQCLEDLDRELPCRPAILHVTITPAADAEILNTLSVIEAVGPRGDYDLRDTGTVIVCETLCQPTVVRWDVQMGRKNSHDGLIVRVCSTMMDRADDRTASKYSKRFGFEPLLHSNSVLLECLAKYLLDSASGQKHRELAILSELPENLDATLFDLLVKLVDDKLQGFCQLYGLVLGNLNKRSHVDVDCSSLCKPLSQVRLGGPNRGRVANDGATGNNMSGNLDGEVKLRERGHQNLDIVRAMYKIHGSFENRVGVEI